MEHIWSNKCIVYTIFSDSIPTFENVKIQISWHFMKPADQDPHFFSAKLWIHIDNEII